MKREPILIYNLFPLLYGDILNWYEVVDKAKFMGFNTIYLNPVFQSGLSGSLYSIREHFKIDRRFSGSRDDKTVWSEIKKFNSYVHKKHMKVIIDLVINHTAIDSPLIKEHPEWFVIKNGKVVHPGAFDNGHWVEWGDLALVNNFNSKDKKNLFEYWVKLVYFYLDTGFDGFRADAAYQVPVELWDYLIKKAREKNPDVIFIAETLGCDIDDVIEIAKVGFTYTFNSVKYWNYRDPWPLEQLIQQLIFLKSVSSISFPESHDTERLFKEADQDIKRVKAKFFNCLYWSSGLLIPSGFEYCYRNRLNVVSTTPQLKETINIDISHFIKDAIELKKQYSILSEDSYIDFVHLKDSGDVLALLKISKNREERCLFLLNRDFSNYQRVYFKNIFEAFRLEGKIVDISLDYKMDFIPKEFEYNLMPGQVKFLYMKGKGGFLNKIKR